MDLFASRLLTFVVILQRAVPSGLCPHPLGAWLLTRLWGLSLGVTSCWESSGGGSSCTQGPFPEPPSPSNTTSLASTSDAPEVIGAVGGSVTFRSKISAEGPAFWNFGSDSIATVPPGNPHLVLFADKKYRTRFNFSENGHVLTISQLTLEDAGIYSAKIDGRTSSFTLRVYRELLEPTVTCEAQNCSAGSCFFSLRCSTPGAGFGNVSYFWSRGEQLDKGPTVLVANKSSGSDPESVTCTAQNPVSIRNVTVPSPGGLCAENAAHSPGPDALSSSGVGIGVVAGIGTAVFLLASLSAFLWKSKGWRKSHLSQADLKDTAAVSDYTTVYAEVGPSQQSIPNGIKAKPKAATPEPSSTVYALVKHPEQVDEGKEENVSTSILELV